MKYKDNLMFFCHYMVYNLHYQATTATVLSLSDYMKRGFGLSKIRPNLNSKLIDRSYKKYSKTLNDLYFDEEEG